MDLEEVQMFDKTFLTEKSKCLGNSTSTNTGAVPPTKMPFPKNITKIIAGGESSVALNATGHLFTLGRNTVYSFFILNNRKVNLVMVLSIYNQKLHFSITLMVLLMAQCIYITL
jgi:alpha-tubulin suppressor-like RCC1 family protein